MTFRFFSRFIGAVMILFVLAGCAKKQAVILVADPDGNVGKVGVVTDAGSQLLDKQNAMTVVSDRSAAPSQVRQADPAYIAATFAEALAVEPLAPEKFILFFEPNRTVLVPQSQAEIASILEAIKRRGPITIRVIGHADSVGSDQLNDRLARDRAQSVRDLLVEKGGNPDLMSVSSHGKGNPLVPTPDGIPEPRNRRVEIILR